MPHALKGLRVSLRNKRLLLTRPRVAGALCAFNPRYSPQVQCPESVGMMRRVALSAKVLLTPNKNCAQADYALDCGANHVHNLLRQWIL
jgi:hypothetical protein